MAIYKCSACGNIYDEEAEGVLFCDLPEDWCCPDCGAPGIEPMGTKHFVIGWNA